MITEGIYYRAVSAAQIALAAEIPDLRPDGKWGNFTESAYQKASPSLRKKVDSIIRVLTDGGTPEDLRAYRRKQKTTALIASGNSDIKSIIIAAANEEGVPVTTALKIAKLESNFNPRAVSPTGAKGLFQMTSIATKDVQQRMGYSLKDPFDPRDNARAGMKYIKLVARDLGARLDETAKIYMGFNIGPAGAKAVMTGQPEKVAKLIKLQAYGKQGPERYAANLQHAVENALV